MTEHIRHRSGSRNRRKTKHHIDCALEELEAMWSKVGELEDMVRYVRSRFNRIRNRIKAEHMNGGSNESR